MSTLMGCQIGGKFGLELHGAISLERIVHWRQMKVRMDYGKMRLSSISVTSMVKKTQTRSSKHSGDEEIKLDWHFHYDKMFPKKGPFMAYFTRCRWKDREQSSVKLTLKGELSTMEVDSKQLSSKSKTKPNTELMRRSRGTIPHKLGRYRRP